MLDPSALLAYPLGRKGGNFPMSDKRNLEIRGHTWWFVRAIPKALAGFMPEKYTGKAHVKINLHTSDLREAHHRRRLALAEFEKVVNEAERAKRGDAAAEIMRL